MSEKPVVIVTGASRGLGAAVARWLAKSGAAVTLVARSEEKLLEVAADVGRLGGSSLVVKADVSDFHACRTAVETTRDHFGRIDSLAKRARGTGAPGSSGPLHRLAGIICTRGIQRQVSGLR